MYILVIGNNFIRTILRLANERSELKVVTDQNGVPTNTKWLAELSLKLLEQGDVLSGIYHAVEMLSI
jgi:dTDP-4-dehydrorhamnose reductase